MFYNANNDVKCFMSYVLREQMLILHLFLNQEKILKLYERKQHGAFDTNSHIQKKKEFRNPR